MNMAWLEFARHRAISLSKGNFRLGGMTAPLHGLVLHIEVGTEDGTFGWFNTSRADRQRALDAAWEKKGSPGRRPVAGNSSAHFGNPKNGQLEQFVDTKDEAFAQVSGNSSWLSVENEGVPGDSLTIRQIRSLAELMAYLNFHEGVPLKEADNPSEFGLGYHGMGGVAWGGHFQCPGVTVIRQRSLIIEMAQGILHGRRPSGSIPEWLTGWWSVNDTNQYYYHFSDGGEVTHTRSQPASGKAPPPKHAGNRGTVRMTDHGLDILWNVIAPGGPTIEKFTRMGWSSTTEMFGTSNKYGGLSARKIT
jgi:hypothetical protein